MHMRTYSTLTERDGLRWSRHLRKLGDWSGAARLPRYGRGIGLASTIAATIVVV